MWQIYILFYWCKILVFSGVDKLRAYILRKEMRSPLSCNLYIVHETTEGYVYMNSKDISAESKLFFYKWIADYWRLSI